ncbi:MAG TPA: MgtC/SapB family protein [Parasegetibacter sp.]
MEKEIILQFLLATLWGGIVGLEREYRNKSAGFRTMTMISIGACFFTVMSQSIGLPGSTDRIASNIVTGIGFLGAGVIFKDDNRVNGITTAATIWAVAAVGMGIGSGYYIASGFASLMIIFVLTILPYVEAKMDKVSQTKTYVIESLYTDEITSRYEDLLKSLQLRYQIVSWVKRQDSLTVTWMVRGKEKHQIEFMKFVLSDELVRKLEY